ncbi:TPA: hypothetical protein ACGBG5_003290 [Enterococcus faecalis]
MMNFFKRCKHNYKLMAAIGGDMQSRAFMCLKCGKKKVEVDGIGGKPDYDYVLKHGKKFR